MSEQKLKNVIKKHLNRKIICVFVFFCTSEEKNRKKKKIEKRENSPQGTKNIRKNRKFPAR